MNTEAGLEKKFERGGPADRMLPKKRKRGLLKINLWGRREDEGQTESKQEEMDLKALRMRYLSTIEHIHFTKTQQWRLACGVILLLAIVGGCYWVVKSVKSDPCSGQVALWIEVLVTGVVYLVLILLVVLQMKVREYKRRIDEAILPMLLPGLDRAMKRVNMPYKSRLERLLYKSGLEEALFLACLILSIVTGWIVLTWVYRNLF